MKRMRWLVAMLALLSLLAAACGSDDPETTTSDDSPTTTADTSTDDTTDDGAVETTTTADDSGDAPAEIATDFGVDVDAKVIRVGLNADRYGCSFDSGRRRTRSST